MSRLLRHALTLALTLAPVLALAAGAAPSGRSPLADLALKFLNFGILAGILFYFLRKPVSQALTDRRENIRKALDDARVAKEAAEAKLQEYQLRVANLEKEIEQLRAEFKAEGERQKARIISEGEQAAESVRRHAEATATNEIKRAQDQLRTEAVQLAMRLAEDLLTKAYSQEDQKKAVKLTIDSVEGLH